jgi:hypothetical protein
MPVEEPLGVRGSRPRRREPLRAPEVPSAPSIDDQIAALLPPIDDTAVEQPGAARARRVRLAVVPSKLAAVGLAVAIGGVALFAAATSPGSDDAGSTHWLQPGEDLSVTPTSAPRIAIATASGDAIRVVDLGDTADLTAALREAGESVPVTGGLTDLIRRYFGSFTAEAIQIVQCESGFYADAVGTNTNGTQDHGLFQINDVHHEAFERAIGRPWADRYDPEANTAFAAWLFERAQGWGPWRCNVSLSDVDSAADADADADADE